MNDPAGSLLDLSRQTLLVIAPHPDDEVLGCGGLISKIKKAGGKAFVLIMTVGDHKQFGSVSDTNLRLKETQDVMSYLGVDGYEIALVGDDYHLKLDSIPQKTMIDLIESKSRVSIESVKPTILALPYKDSYFQDHRAVFEAGFAAARPRPRGLKHTPDMVISYEQPDVYWSSKPFASDLLVDISRELDNKLMALSLYSSQSHPAPHPCSLENVRNIAKVRGSQICVDAAEAYHCYRYVV